MSKAGDLWKQTEDSRTGRNGVIISAPVVQNNHRAPVMEVEAAVVAAGPKVIGRGCKHHNEVMGAETRRKLSWSKLRPPEDTVDKSCPRIC